MRRSTGANYIGATERPKVRSLKTKLTTVVAAVAAAMTVLVGVGVGALALDAGTTKNVTSANAGLGISCTSVIGGNMDKRDAWGSGPLAARLYEDLNGRTLTLSEVVGSPAWTNYTGIGPGPESDFFVKSYADVIDPLKLNGTALDDGTGEGSSATTAGTLPQKYSTNWGAIQEKLTGERNTGTCFWEQTFVTNIANGAGLGLANSLQMFVTWVSTNAFNSSFICDPNTPSTNGCIDLVKVIGGRDDAGYQSGGDGGIIGNLTDSIYKPLVLIVVVVTALGIAYTGLVKRQFREALTHTVWLIFSFIIGLLLLLNPSMLAKAPMIATNAVTGCVIGSFNGVNCFDGTGFSTNTSDGVALTADSGVCISDATSATADQITGLAVNSMGCTIWKTFILQNYAKGGFGVNLDQLEVKNPDTVAGKAAVAAGVDPNKFCYSLQTTGSISSYDGEWLQSKSGGSQICNLAVYNMLMQMKVTPAGETAASVPTQYDPDWYDLIVTTASSEKMWPIWSNGGQQFAQGFVAVLSVILGGILIVVASVAALMYYLTAIILLIFAPLFILVGINPGRGKKIMFGWVETILSSILKYLASALFLLVSLALYSAVLGAADPMAALLFVAILSMVLWMYRKEIVDTFSKVSLGGERMANMMDKQVPILGASGRQLSDKVSKMPGALAGGAIGGLMAGGIGKAGEGLKIAGQNELRSAPGLVGRAAQAKERQMRDNKADFNRDASKAKDVANRAGDTANRLTTDVDSRERDLRNAKDGLHNAELDTQKASGAVDYAEEELKQAEATRVTASENEATAKVDFDAASFRADAHRDAVETAATTGVRNEDISPAMAEFKKLTMSIEQLGAQARLADRQGNGGRAIELRVQQEDMKREAVQVRAESGVDELTWKNEEARFNQLLEREQMARPELMTDNGAIHQYSSDEYVDSGQRVLDTTKATKDAELNVNVASQKLSHAKEDVLNINTEVTQRSENIKEQESDIAEARKKASAARVDAAALDANAAVLFDQNQALGPGKMPTVGKANSLKKEATRAGEAVRESHAMIERIAEGEDVEAPRRSVASTVTDVFRGNLDEQAAAAATERETATRRAESARRAAQTTAAQLEDSSAAALLATRENRAATVQTREADATAAMADKYAKDHRDEIAKQEAQLARLTSLIEAGQPVPYNGQMLDAAALERVKNQVEANLNTKREEMPAVATRAENARAEAEANRARLQEAQAAKQEADARVEEAKRRARITSRNEQDRTRQETTAVEITESLTNEQKRARGILSEDQVKALIVSNPITPEHAANNKSLDDLIKLADSLSKAPANQDSANANKIAALQAQISDLAKNVGTTPSRANEGLVESLSKAVASIVKPKEKKDESTRLPAPTKKPAERAMPTTPPQPRESTTRIPTRPTTNETARPEPIRPATPSDSGPEMPDWE